MCVKNLIHIKIDKQIPQEHGYWIWHCTRQDSLNILLPLYFSLEFKQDSHNLSAQLLFQDKDYKLQFLSKNYIQKPQNISIKINTTNKSILFRFMKLEKMRFALSENYSVDKPIIITAKGQKLSTVINLLYWFKEDYKFVVILETDDNGNFPFKHKPSLKIFNEIFKIVPEAIGVLPLLNDWDIPNILCCPKGKAGCYQGDIASLLRKWNPTSKWQLLQI